MVLFKSKSDKDGVSAVGPIVPNEYESLHKTYDKSEFVEKLITGLQMLKLKTPTLMVKPFQVFTLTMPLQTLVIF